MFCVGKHALAAAPLDEGCDEGVAEHPRGRQARRSALQPAQMASLGPTQCHVRSIPGRRRPKARVDVPNAAQRTWPPSQTISASHLVPRGARLASVRVPAVPGSPRGLCHEHSPVSLAFLRTHRVAAFMAEHTGGRADSSRCVLPLRVRGRDSRGLPPAHRHLLAELGR